MKLILAIINHDDANTSIIDPNSGKPIEFVLIGQDSRDGEENQIGRAHV